MKKNILTMAALMAFAGMQAQIQTNNGTVNGITNSNVLLDGSSAFSTEVGAGPYVGKGIIIPSVDLVNFEFDLSLADGFTFPTYFDGMIVYNNATGNTLTTGNRPSSSLAVTPGYYYFSNPNGASNGNVTGGQWKALGGTASGGDNLGDHSATKTLALNGFDLRLKGASDGNQALAYNPTIDGPRLWGNAGGALGTVNGTNALTWDNAGNVTSPSSVRAGNSTVGYTLLNTGDSNNSGYVAFHKKDGTRLGYIGYDNSNVSYVAQNGAKHSFTGDVVGNSSFYSGTNSYFRVRGAGGIYWEDYGGGWNMSDNTWLRASNDKGIYTGGNIMTGNGTIQAGNSIGNVKLVPSDTSHTGYVGFYRANNTRLGYIGYDNSNVTYQAENGALHVFSGGNVGIGVNNPGEALHVNGNVRSGSGGTQGYVILRPGDASLSGLTQYYRPTGVSSGYIGASATDMLYAAQNGAQHLFIGGNVVSNNEVYAGTNSYFRVRGTGGFYFENYGGGWNMTDTDWIRAMNNKNIYTAGVGRFDTRVETARVQGTSDRRFKKDITPIYNATEKLNQLNGYTYTWKDKKEFPGQALGEGKDMGVVAQEVEKVFPDAVMTNKDGYKSVNYNALIPVLIEALKESNKKIQALEDRLNGASAPAETSARLDRKADGITASATPMKIN